MFVVLPFVIRRKISHWRSKGSPAIVVVQSTPRVGLLFFSGLILYICFSPLQLHSAKMLRSAPQAAPPARSLRKKVLPGGLDPGTSARGVILTAVALFPNHDRNNLLLRSPTVFTKPGLRVSRGFARFRPRSRARARPPPVPRGPREVRGAGRRKKVAKGAARAGAPARRRRGCPAHNALVRSPVPQSESFSGESVHECSTCVVDALLLHRDF